jgi:hypothetical protein
MTILAGVWRHRDKLSDAETLQRTVLAKREEIFGQCSLPVSKSQARLAMIKVSQGKHTEAEGLWERAIELQRTFVTEPDQDLLDNMTSFSCTKYRLGKFTDAEDLLQRVICCREQNDDGATPALENSLHCLAAVKTKLGKFTEATDLQFRASKMAVMVYGVDSAKCRQSFVQLSRIMAHRG